MKPLFVLSLLLCSGCNPVTVSFDDSKAVAATFDTGSDSGSPDSASDSAIDSDSSADTALDTDVPDTDADTGSVADTGPVCVAADVQWSENQPTQWTSTLYVTLIHGCLTTAHASISEPDFTWGSSSPADVAYMPSNTGTASWYATDTNPNARSRDDTETVVVTVTSDQGVWLIDTVVSPH